MGTAIEKRCVGCGQDVSTVKRVRDDAGRYFCQPCYETALARVSSSTRQPAVPKLSAGIDVPAKPSPTLRSPRTDSSASSSMETGVYPKARGNKTSLLRLLCMLVVAVAATSAALYLFVLKTQNERITETADTAMKQSGANEQKSRELSELQERVAKRRGLALNAVGGGPGAFKAFSDEVTDGGKKSMVATLDADPIFTSISRDRSDVRPLILSLDADALIAGLDAKGTAALSKPDQVYLIQLATVIHTSCSDSGPPPAPIAVSGAVTGDVWVKKTTGEVLPITATEVYLLPPTVRLVMTDPALAHGVEGLKIESDVYGRQTDTDSRSLAKMANDALRLIDPSLHKDGVSTIDLVLAGKMLVDLKSTPIRNLEALGRSRPAGFDTLERDIQNETLWRYTVSTATAKALTGRDGQFKIPSVKPGEYVIACRAFLPASQAVVYWAEPITVQSSGETPASLSADKGVVVGY